MSGALASEGTIPLSADEGVTLSPERELRRELGRIVLERLRPSAIGISLLFVPFLVFNLFDPWLGLESRDLLSLSLANLAVIAFFGAAYTMLRGNWIDVDFAHPFVALSAMVLLANTLYSLFLTGDLFYTHYLVIMLVGLGAVVLSFRCQVLIVTTALGAWLATAWSLATPQELARFSFVLFSAAVASTTLQWGRTQNRKRLIREVERRRVIEAQLSDANQKLEEISRRDPLTNLLNRRGIFERLGVELSRSERGHPLAILLVDLDGFKIVNDRYGHVEGDRLLEDIAKALGRSTRASDAVGRYGGDEFLIVLADTRLEDAQATVDRLVERVRQVGSQRFPSSPVTASGGLAVAVEGEDPIKLIERADAAVYDAKRRGGDGIRSAIAPADNPS